MKIAANLMLAFVLASSLFGCSAGATEGEDEGGATDAALKVSACEGPGHFTCESGQYCRAIGQNSCPDADTFGICARQPTACTDVYAPVCGCDGVTYSNACFAAAAGAAVDHAGACAAKAPACGGFAGIRCPGAGKCVDDPADDCDPKQGGADCGGICTCIQTVLCIRGSTFDSDPHVCSCVPSSTR